MRSDAELQRDVLDELRRDERLCIDDLDVQVEGRVVTLTGQAETPVQCWRALQIARLVAGLARVSNRIVVRPQH
jgi:osmotically-inducible protein OsmY